MSTKTHFFVLGATGYIGGTAFSRFLLHPNAANFTFTALVRSPEKAEKLKSLNVDAVVGSQKDVELIEKLASQADVILSFSDSDDLPLIQSLLRGAKKRYEQTGVKVSFIHISGVAILLDDAYGAYGETIINDFDNDSIENLPAANPHRNVDIPLVAADGEGYVKTYIIVPGFVYGLARGKLVDSGIQQHFNRYLSMFIGPGIDRGRMGYVGEGKNLWTNVDVNDLGDLLVLVYIFAATDQSTGHGRDGFYFAENGESTWVDIYNAMGDALLQAGKVSNATASSFTQEEADKYYGSFMARLMGGNTRCTASRSRSIGWKPVSTTKNMLQILGTDVKEYLRHSNSKPPIVLTEGLEKF